MLASYFVSTLASVIVVVEFVWPVVVASSLTIFPGISSLSQVLAIDFRLSYSLVTSVHLQS